MTKRPENCMERGASSSVIPPSARERDVSLSLLPRADKSTREESDPWLLLPLSLLARLRKVGRLSRGA